MNKRFAWFTAVLVNLLLVSSINSQSKITVYKSGTEGYESFRIPAIVSFQKTLLAFAEGRVKGAADFGDINIVLKKSTDNGKTWSDLSVVASNGHLQAGNPAPVVDLTDSNYPNGRIFLFYNTGNQSEGDIRKGKGMREVWYKTSVDAGNTWSDPVNITLQVHRPNQPSINPAYHFSEDWRSYANTPGHAMQFDEGKYKGRIFLAANHSQGNPRGKFEDYFSHGFYTDNHGLTFQLSPSLNLPGSNEATATQISNNRLLLNARNQKGDIRARIIAISNNGGAQWDTLYFDKNLPDPVCEGSILAIGKKANKQILAFCNAADTKNRNNLTVRISKDDGQTWSINKLIDKSAEQDTSKDNAAYSDIVKLSNKKLGILYEKGNYATIVFTVVKW